MKTFIQTALYTILITFAVSAQITESFDAYYLRLNSVRVGNTIQVAVEMAMAPSQAGEKLGTSTFQFTFDTAKLSNPSILSHNITGNYNSVTLTQPRAGKVAFNTSLNLIGTGQVVNTFPSYSTLAILQFDVEGMAYTDFIWTDEILDTKETIVFFDDENVLRHPVQMESATDFFLPVELNQFAAAWENENQQAALLTWNTASENGLNRFEIERSRNGVDGWELISTVFGEGYDNAGAAYNYTDEDAQYNTENGYVYYRLKLIDNDGSIEYSEIRTLNSNKELAEEYINIFPNPFVDYITVETDLDATTPASLEILSANGQQVLAATVSTGTAQQMQLSVSHLAAGAYIIRLVQGTDSFTSTLVKK